MRLCQRTLSGHSEDTVWSISGHCVLCGHSEDTCVVTQWTSMVTQWTLCGHSVDMDNRGMQLTVVYLENDRQRVLDHVQLT